jgi:hypothetical protein
MIAGPHNVLPVRQTATTSGNASRRHVRRISVASALICSALGFVSITRAADAKKDTGIKIIPGPRFHSTMPPVPQYEEMRPGRPAARPPGKPAHELPPLPAEETPPKGKLARPQHQEKPQAGQLRIIPARRVPLAPNAQRYEEIYRSIPYSRTAYEMNPSYRQELALSLLFNRFPPPPMVMPGSPDMGTGPQQDPMSGGFGGWGAPFAGPMGNGPLLPPDFVPGFGD